MNWKTILSKPWVLMMLMAIPIGILWGIIAIICSIPNPPAWAQPAMQVVGTLSGLAFVVVWFRMTFRRKRY